MNALVALILVTAVALMLLIFTRRQRDGRSPAIRPLPATNSLAKQVGEAIESGRQLHVSLGQGSLISAASPASIAAIHALDYLAKDGCASGTPPLTTVGDGTLLPVAQDSLRQAHAAAGRLNEYKPSMTQFLASSTNAFAYAGGIAAVLQQGETSGNLLLGRFGPELAIPAEAAARKNMEQVIGTDDPSALAVATAATANILAGEELFAAGAYLEGKPDQLASLQIQDLLRWLIIITILLLALGRLLIR